MGHPRIDIQSVRGFFFARAWKESKGETRMKKRMLLTLLFTFLTIPGISQAEEKKENEQTMTTMEEVVVTATKTEEQRKDIPNSVIIKDSIDIEGAAEQPWERSWPMNWVSTGGHAETTAALHRRSELEA